MLGMKNHFNISGSIEIREVDIAGVACIAKCSFSNIQCHFVHFVIQKQRVVLHNVKMFHAYECSHISEPLKSVLISV